MFYKYSLLTHYLIFIIIDTCKFMFYKYSLHMHHLSYIYICYKPSLLPPSTLWKMSETCFLSFIGINLNRWKTTSIQQIAWNPQSIISINYRSSPVRPKSESQLLKLTKPHWASQLDPELGTAQPQLVLL